MPAPHPRMHGLTHVYGGPDPVPGLLPRVGDTLDEKILALAPAGFWKLNESTGTVAHDSSGFDNDLETVGAETPPVWGAPAGPPGEQTANFYTADPEDLTPDDAAVVSRAWEPIDTSFTAALWVNRNSLGYGTAMGQGNPGRASGTGWQIAVQQDATSAGEENRPYAHLGNGIILYALNEVPPGEWVMVAVTVDGDTGLLKLYVDGLLQDAVDASGWLPVTADRPLWIGHDQGLGSSSIIPSNLTMSYAFLIMRALSGVELEEINAAADPEAALPEEGWVLTLDEDGLPVWAPPPAVTVNGSELPASNTPTPTPAPPPDDHDESHPSETDWIEDQPFLWGGGDFTVQPNTWTTIPWSSPLMERLSNSTPSGFGPLELDDDDPDSAGWVSDASDYTQRAIIVPHDMPFLTGGDWMQICLKLEDPAVQASTSYRALRIFETTRQKTLIMARELRELACLEGGGVNVYREEAAHALDSDGFVFAEGDTGSTGSHGNIMFAPNSGYAYYLNGEDWLPKVAGVPTLKEGMRLVAQAWHDATVALTFSATNAFPYRPHFVVRQTVQRSWGVPWSDWPEP